MCCKSKIQDIFAPKNAKPIWAKSKCAVNPLFETFLPKKILNLTGQDPNVMKILNSRRFCTKNAKSNWARSKCNGNP